LGDLEALAIVRAAGWHDLGKRRALWQRSIGNHDFPRLVLAKSAGKVLSGALSNYRHEFGSLIEVSQSAEFPELESDLQDLILHLMAAHHGRARPHFSFDEAFDPNYPEKKAAEIASEVPRRFARLQRKYGRWGLAYLESVVRAADALASQGIEASKPEVVGLEVTPAPETGP
jgi:CRISPR-associated endonuclease/helicase Cas3